MSPDRFVNKILNTDIVLKYIILRRDFTDKEIEYICSTLYNHIKQGRESKGSKLTLEQYTRITKFFDSINVACLSDTHLKIQVLGYKNLSQPQGTYDQKESGYRLLRLVLYNSTDDTEFYGYYLTQVRFEQLTELYTHFIRCSRTGLCLALRSSKVYKLFKDEINRRLVLQ